MLWFRLLLVFLIVLVNSFFVAAEYSLITLRRTRIEELVAEGRPGARTLRYAVDHLPSFVAAVQLGTTMASLALGWLGEPEIAQAIEPLLRFLPPNAAQISAHSLAVVLAFLVITTVQIIIGELVPKNAALRRPEAVAWVVTPPLSVFSAAFQPFIAFLSGTSSLLLQALGLPPTPPHQLVHSVEELKMLVTASREAGVLDESEEDIIERAFNLADIKAHQVMVPRTELASVPITATVADVFDEVSRTEHSQFPAYDQTIDDVVGMVYLKDLAPRFGRVDLRRALIRPLVREALILPESVSVDELLDRMRKHRTHVAILVDEYGGTAGMVTLVDILEEIVGYMPAEWQKIEPEIVRIEGGGAVVDGFASLHDVNEQLDLDLTSEDYDTIGGYVLGALGRRPEVGDEVKVDQRILRVEQTDGVRVARISIILG